MGSRDVPPAHLDAALRRGERRRKYAEQRRFPGAVRAEYARDARLESELEVAKDLGGTERTGEVLDDDSHRGVPLFSSVITGRSAEGERRARAGSKWTRSAPQPSSGDDVAELGRAAPQGRCHFHAGAAHGEDGADPDDQAGTDSDDRPRTGGDDGRKQGDGGHGGEPGNGGSQPTGEAGSYGDHHRVDRDYCSHPGEQGDGPRGGGHLGQLEERVDTRAVAKGDGRGDDARRQHQQRRNGDGLASTTVHCADQSGEGDDHDRARQPRSAKGGGGRDGTCQPGGQAESIERPLEKGRPRRVQLGQHAPEHSVEIKGKLLCDERLAGSALCEVLQCLWIGDDARSHLAERRQRVRRVVVVAHFPPSSSRNRARARNSRLFTVPGATPATCAAWVTDRPLRWTASTAIRWSLGSFATARRSRPSVVCRLDHVQGILGRIRPPPEAPESGDYDMAPLSACRAHEPAPGDPPQPGPDLAVTSERGGRSPHTEEGVLKHLLGELARRRSRPDAT